MARNLGNISRLAIVKNITNVIHLIDPLSGQTAQMSAEVFWREPIRPVITAARSRFTRYVVLGKEPVVIEHNASKKRATKRNRNKLALVTVAKEDDLGINDVQFAERSFVGYLMKSGDVVTGYDLTDVQFVDDDAEEARAAGKLPDVILLRKLYGGVATNESDAAKQRPFRLQRLDADAVEASRARKAKKDTQDDDMDEEDFLREVEADKEMRMNMNLYKSELVAKTKEMPKNEMDESNGGDEEDEDDQKVTLNELLDGLILDEGPDKEMTDEIDEDQMWGGIGQNYVEEGEKAAKDGITYTGRDEANNVKAKDAAVAVGEVFGKQFMDKKFNFL